MTFYLSASILLLLVVISVGPTLGCQFYPLGEYLRFVRIPENLQVGSEVIQVEVHPRRNLSLQPVDKIEDVEYFKLRALNHSVVSVRLARSLEEIVDTQNPQSVLKFRMVCDYDDEDDQVSSYLSVSVYIEDINDNAPVFVDAPYSIRIEENTAPGTVVFNHILAVDRDKPNTANSDVHYSLIGGNEKAKFSLEDNSPASLIIRKPLDYDTGDVKFILTILASDRGIPQRSSTAIITVTVNDNDDLNPKFTKDVYKIRIPEHYPLTGKKIHQELLFTPPIRAYDQDKGLNATLRYDLISGNENDVFQVDARNGSVFLLREIDADVLPSDVLTLQVQATQIDNALRYDTAKIHVEILDLNDNQPQFEVDVYNISIVENLPNGFSVLQVSATDRDQGENGEFVYHLVDPSQSFSIDAKSGWLSVRNQGKLDREQRSTLSMRVYAREKVPSVIGRVTEISEPFVAVEVTLLDANDNNPVFIPNNVYEFSVPYNVPIGHAVGKVEAKDLDLGNNGLVIYSIQRNVNVSTNGNSDGYFAIDPDKGTITVANTPLQIGRHTIFIEASDQPTNPTEKRFALAVVNVNAFSRDPKKTPEFVGAPYEFWVGNDVPIGTSVGQIRIEGAPKDENIVYDLLHSYHEGVPFAVEESSGTVSVVDEMKKYDRPIYYFEAVATNEKYLTLTTNTTIHVVDTEVNAHSFRNNEPIALSFKVMENVAGTLVGQLNKNGFSKYNISIDSSWRNQRYVIVNNQPDIQNSFDVTADGMIYTKVPLDREEKANYQLIIFAELGRKVVRNLYHVNITVDDENDNPPLFSRDWYDGVIKENSVAGTEVKMEHPIKVQDADFGPNSNFMVLLRGNGSENFDIDQKTKKVIMRDGAILDREQRDKYVILLVARDRGNLSSEAKLIIHIEDTNDHTPKFVQMIVHHKEGVEIAPQTRPTKIIAETNLPPTIVVPETSAIGTPVIRLRAIDEDIGENAELTYDIINEKCVPNTRPLSTTHFAIHPITGEVTVANVLPPEVDCVLNISATDKGNLAGHTSVKLHIKDVNNNAPVFEKSWYDYSIPEGVYKNHIIGKIQANDEDFGENGNVSYSILQKRNGPFVIHPDGSLAVEGTLDRENQEIYSFRIMAEDRAPLDKRLRGTVDVDIRVLDINDNYPMFYNYDKLAKLASSTVPVYETSVIENAGSGIPLVRVFANDTDLPANGNGMVLFHIPYKRNQRELFAIDSKEGIITTLSSLDYEEEKIHNITVLASDLGKPSLTSTALVIVSVVDAQEPLEDISSPIFAHRCYEMEVEENCAIPVKLLALNVSTEYTRKFGNLRFSLILDEQSRYFKVYPSNGSIELVVSPDREVTPVLEAKIRVEKIVRKGKNLQLLYPVQQQTTLTDVAPNEVKIIVHVLDENDNAPVFDSNDRPIIAVLPNTAPYGYVVTKVHAHDADIGINADIKYEILNHPNGNTPKFIIDSTSGYVKTANSFLQEEGEIYTFDVRATDKDGAVDGKSAIINVFVFVISDKDKVMLISKAKPTDIERDAKNITRTLSDISEFDVRIRKIEPHYEKDTQTLKMTDVYLYAVDTSTNSVVDNEVLSQALKSKEAEIKQILEPYKVLAVASASIDNEIKTQKSQKPMLSGLETMTVLLGCVIFLGAFTAAVCIACFNRKRSKYKNSANLFPPLDPTDLPFSLYTGTKNISQMSGCRPRSLFNPFSFVEDSTDSYTDLEWRRRRRLSCHQSQYFPRDHPEEKCSQSLIRSRSMGLIGASLGSLHSSGRDSGIEAHNQKLGGKCQCKHTLFSSGNSSNASYEDSLKSLQPHQVSSESETERRTVHQKMPDFTKIHKELAGRQTRIRQSKK